MNYLTLLIALVGLTLAAVPARAAESAADETAVFSADRTLYRDLDLQLDGAVFGGEAAPAAEERKDLMLYLGYGEGGFRERFIGWAGERRDHGPEDDKTRRLNNMDHEGTVTSQKVQGDRVTLAVDMLVHRDPWVPGGEGSYEIELTRRGDEFEGTYRGTYKGQLVEGRAHGELAEQPWPSQVRVADWEPLEPGTHPRLMFRKGHLPEIKRRAQTAEGQLIVARLRELLGGGEAVRRQGYTLGDGAGYGMLYQLTGEQKYAELAKEATQLALSGVRDRDGRYAFVNAGGKLRQGPSAAQVALAYDLAYDGWDDDFRRQVAKALQDVVWNPDAPQGAKVQAEPTGGDLIFNTGGGQHSPHSNHYGAWNGGAGVAILAILGDPGTDDAVTYRAHRVLQQRAQRALEVGYGDSAWFFEGHHGGRLNLNTGLAEYLLALRNTAGLDLVDGFPGGDKLVTKWLYELTRQNGKIRDVHRGIYAGHGFERSDWSGSGDFSIGFGLVPEREKPAVKWFFQHVINPVPPQQSDFDALGLPSRAAWALVTWPVDREAVNPDELLPRYLLDGKANYYVLRSGWSEDGNDWVVAVQNGSAMLRGPGVKADKLNMPSLGTVREVRPLAKAEGEAAVIDAGDHRLVADMTGVSGAPIMVVEMPRATREAAGEGEAAGDQPAIGTTETQAEGEGEDDAAALFRKRFGGATGNATPPPPPARGDGDLQQDVELTRTQGRIAGRSIRVGVEEWRVYTIQAGAAPKLEAIEHDGRPALAVGDRVVVVGEDGRVELAEQTSD